MIALLLHWMRATDAPAEQYDRLGLPREGDPGKPHLLASRQFEAARGAQLVKS